MSSAVEPRCSSIGSDLSWVGLDEERPSEGLLRNQMLRHPAGTRGGGTAGRRAQALRPGRERRFGQRIITNRQYNVISRPDCLIVLHFVVGPFNSQKYININPKSPSAHQDNPSGPPWPCPNAPRNREKTPTTPLHPMYQDPATTCCVPRFPMAKYSQHHFPPRRSG